MNATTWIRVVLLAVGLTAALPACRRQEPPPTGGPVTTSAVESPSEAEQAALRAFVQETSPPRMPGLPAGHPPIDGPPPREAGVGPAGAAPVALQYVAPSAWQREPVRSPLRSDQYLLPRAAGDAEDAELAVFGGIGGSVEDNVNRWRGQFSTPDGTPIPDEAFYRESFEVGPLRVTVVDVAGRYAADGGMAGGPPAALEGYRMLAAVVETAGGPWYFKVVGPAATVAHHREDFLALLRTLKVE